ncbi:hypothetical protein FOF52_17905 [Thermobifida alba]|uniref:WD40 repeat domain-containing protein n=1 Tax=Thermobifida alba TaxID=53522 RepID=A0ABY4L6R5_THEAE|nr:hypothetical protein FOF52_17905 [Thermobifida alba]
MLASGGDEVIEVWEVESGRSLAVVPYGGSSARIDEFVLSPDGSRLLSSDSEGRIILWDVAPGGSGDREFLDLHDSEVTALAFHPDGSLVVSGDEKGAIELHVLETADDG